MVAFGRHRARSPFFATAVLCATLIERAVALSRSARFLAEIAQGRLILSLAYLEPVGEKPVCVENLPDQAGYVRLRGTKTLVLAAPYADQFIVSARRGDTVELYLLPRELPGLTHREYVILTGEKVWDLHLNGVTVPKEARLSEADAAASVQYTLERGALAMTFDALGAAQVLLTATTSYAIARRQFGQSLSSLQVIRHRLADMTVACEEARSISLKAALKMSDEQERSLSVSAAMWKSLSCVRFVAEQAIQIHGAMGISEELSVGEYFRRILAAELIFNLPAHHLQRYLELSRQASRH
jgi:alkylation response protein AidB-like acyl-CoA dehydrogenase